VFCSLVRSDADEKLLACGEHIIGVYWGSSGGIGDWWLLSQDLLVRVANENEQRCVGERTYWWRNQRVESEAFSVEVNIGRCGWFESKEYATSAFWCGKSPGRLLPTLLLSRFAGPSPSALCSQPPDLRPVVFQAQALLYVWCPPGSPAYSQLHDEESSDSVVDVNRSDSNVRLRPNLQAIQDSQDVDICPLFLLQTFTNIHLDFTSNAHWYHGLGLENACLW